MKLFASFYDVTSVLSFCTNRKKEEADCYVHREATKQHISSAVFSLPFIVSEIDRSGLAQTSRHNHLMSCFHHFRFRRGFKQFFRCCPFVHVGPEVLTRREVLTSRYSCTGSPDHHRIVRNGKSTKFQFLRNLVFNDEWSHFLPLFSLPDTERSFLYSCSGSPKSHRKSHGEQITLP